MQTFCQSSFLNLQPKGLTCVKQEARSLFVPWLQVARAWKDKVGIHRRILRLLDQARSVKCEVELVLPVPLPEMPQVTVYLDHKSHLILDIGEAVAIENTDDLMDVTSTLLSAGYGHRRIDIRQGDFAIQIASRRGKLPSECSSTLFDSDSIGDGTRGLIHDAYGHPYLFESVLPSKPPVESVQKVYKGFEKDPEDIQYVAVRKYPRGPGLFLQPLPPTQQSPSTKPYSRVLPMSGLTIDDVSTEYTALGLLMPSLIHYIEIYLIANELSKTLLAPLNLGDISKVVTAICTSSARMPTNLERIELLGDSLLKLLVTLNVSATSKFPQDVIPQEGIPQSVISQPYAPFPSPLLELGFNGCHRRISSTFLSF